MNVDERTKTGEDVQIILNAGEKNEKRLSNHPTLKQKFFNWFKR